MVTQHRSFRVTDSPIYEVVGETLTVPASSGTRLAYNVRPDAGELLVEPVAALRLALVPAIKGLIVYRNGQYLDIIPPDLKPNLFDRASGIATPLLGGLTAAGYLYVGTPRII